MAPERLTDQTLLAFLQGLVLQGETRVSSTRLAQFTRASPATIKRLLRELLQAGRVVREGKARATQYWPADIPRAFAAPAWTAIASAKASHGMRVAETEAPPLAPSWSSRSRRLLRELDKPLGARKYVSSNRSFVERYRPNITSLLPPRLAADLDEAGRMRGQQAAGTYARKVLEQLLVDLSWSSSRLEGTSTKRCSRPWAGPTRGLCATARRSTMRWAGWCASGGASSRRSPA
jgi:hypothetical protein